MREIKFRAWDKEKKCFFAPTYEAYKGNLEELNIGLSGRLALRKIDGFYDESRFEGRFILMQYTGLKDKNGKDVYEGDVVCYVTYDRTEPEGHIGSVEFSDGKFFVRGNGFYSYGEQDFTWSELEVIGNIYEDGGLLTNQ